MRVLLWNDLSSYALQTEDPKSPDSEVSVGSATERFIGKKPIVSILLCLIIIQIEAYLPF